MEFLIAYVPVLACGAVMFFCVRHMSMGFKQLTNGQIDVVPKLEIAELREELARLRAEPTLAAAEETRDG